MFACHQKPFRFLGKSGQLKAANYSSPCNDGALDHVQRQQQGH